MATIVTHGWLVPALLILSLSNAMSSQPAPHPAAEWFPHRSAAAAKGIALVIHGLNLNPERMQGIIGALNESGIDALRVSLSGHGGNSAPPPGGAPANVRLETFKRVSYRLWREEALGAYRAARERAERAHAPLFLVAFSLGGLIGSDLLSSDGDVGFERAVLFAPALSLRSWDYLIRLVSPFPELVIPTLAPRGYLANSGTPVAAYNALFDALEHFESTAGAKLNIPTRVFIDPGDELVSPGGLERLVESRRLDRWKLSPVKKDAAVSAAMLRHIIIDAESVGEAAWAKIRTAMVSHLLGEAP